MSIHPQRAKELTALAQRCFGEVVGELPNNGAPRIYSSPEEVIYFNLVLRTMLAGYVEHVGETYSPRSIVKPLAKIILSTPCPMCSNEEISPIDKYCKICGLSLMRSV